MKRRSFLQFGAAPVAAALSQNAPEAATGDAPQLFVDLDAVEPLENVKQEFHSAEKHPANPVIRRERPWESDRGTWGGLLYDGRERVFKAWYGGVSDRTDSHPATGAPMQRAVLCHALSPDGIHWERPNLGLHEVMGSRRNNVVIGDDHHEGKDHWESILEDPLDADPRRRYKALGWSSFDWKGPMSGIYSMTSPDGLHWTHTPQPIFRHRKSKGGSEITVGDAHTLMIDTLRRRYVAYLRRLPNRAFSVSSDFVSWSAPSMCIQAREGELTNTVYNHQGFVYGDRYLGLLTYFQQNPKDPRVFVRLITSRDGEQWQRPDTGRPLIECGSLADWDRYTNMITGTPPIRVGNRLYIYYRGLASRHAPYEGRDTSVTGGGIGLATLRVDGFASLAAGHEGGTVTTRPFRFRGAHLRVNAKADFGELLAEVLDERMQPIEGFTRQECLPMREDSVDRAIRWKASPSLAALQDRPVRVRFHLRNARLYSFRMTAA